MKLSEITSKKQYTWNFRGVEIALQCFNARFMRNMELEKVNIPALLSNFREEPVQTTLVLFWHLMTPESRVFFENDFEGLFDIISAIEMADLSGLIMQMYEDSQPVGKKFEATPLTKENTKSNGKRSSSK